MSNVGSTNNISPASYASAATGSGIGLKYLTQNVQTALDGNPSQQAAAKQLLQPVLLNSMQEWLQQHPGKSPEDFMQALDNGQVSASDMGLYGKHDPASPNNELISTEKQLHTLLTTDPTFAQSIGITNTKSDAK